MLHLYFQNNFGTVFTHLNNILWPWLNIEFQHWNGYVLAKFCQILQNYFLNVKEIKPILKVTAIILNEMRIFYISIFHFKYSEHKINIFYQYWLYFRKLTTFYNIGVILIEYCVVTRVMLIMKICRLLMQKF